MTENKVIPLRPRRAPTSTTKPRLRSKPKSKPKRESWTAEKKRTFLATLAATCNVSAAVRSIDMSESAVYRLRQRSPEFRAEWQSALREGYAKLEMAMLERAIHGTQKPVYHLGKEIGQVTEYPDRVALTLLTAHREAVTGEVPATQKASDPLEVRRRILEKLAEMSGRLAANDKDGAGEAG